MQLSAEPLGDIIPSSAAETSSILDILATPSRNCMYFAAFLFAFCITTSQCQDDASLVAASAPRAAAAMPPPICIHSTALRSIFLPVCARAAMPYSSARNSSSSTTAKPKFTYRLAAASSAKRTPPRQPQYNRDYFLYTSTHNPPQQPYLRSTKSASGEDAFFATTVGSGNQHNVAFGVADGVGGWQDQGVDPSDFSHGLVGLMAGTAYLWDEEAQKRKVRPLGLLQTAYDAVMGNPRVVAGGSTASLAVIDETGQVECANLGDSAFLLLSTGKITHRSPIQTHDFNTPYQLSKIPPRLQAQHAIFGSQHFSERPSQAEVSRHNVRHGDIVVFATDGVWDNLSAQDALVIISRVMTDGGYWYSEKESGSSGKEMLLNETLIREMPRKITEYVEDTFLPGLLAATLMKEAKAAGLDRRRNSPFAKEVNARYPEEGYQGGKPDDIAVVVCVAVEESPATDGAESAEGEKPIKAKL